jgi:hypothetical protein
MKAEGGGGEEEDCFGDLIFKHTTLTPLPNKPHTTHYNTGEKKSCMSGSVRVGSGRRRRRETNKLKQ